MNILDKVLGIIWGLLALIYGALSLSEGGLKFVFAGIIYILLELFVSYDIFLTLNDSIFGGEIGAVFKKWVVLAIISIILGSLFVQILVHG